MHAEVDEVNIGRRYVAFAINSSSCSVSLQIPGDPIVGLFYNASTISTSSTTTTTSVETTIPVTSVAPQTTIKQNISQQGGYTYTVLLIILIFILLVTYWHATVKKRRKWSNK